MQKKRLLTGVLAALTAGAAAAGCGSSSAGSETEETEIQVFIAASLNAAMTDLAARYHEKHPEVKITYNADSSGTLLTQIEEGYECDIFFSAAQKQMDELEADGLVVEGTRADVVHNQVVVISRRDSGTKVTGLLNLENAESIALAGGSVPAGRYTRQAFIKLGILEPAEDAAEITAQQVSDALGGVEISEQDNVSKVLSAVAEGSCEVGTTYYSDTYGHEDDLEILETVSCDLTGNVIYPAAQVVNDEADEAQEQAAADFLTYLLSDEAEAVFQEYYFNTGAVNTGTVNTSAGQDDAGQNLSKFREPVYFDTGAGQDDAGQNLSKLREPVYFDTGAGQAAAAINPA